jgi:hypothetical protein
VEGAFFLPHFIMEHCHRDVAEVYAVAVCGLDGMNRDGNVAPAVVSVRGLRREYSVDIDVKY